MSNRSSRPVLGRSLTLASNRNDFGNNASGKHRKSLFASFLSYYAPQKRGIIELASSEVVGTAFDPTKHWQE